MVWRPRRKKKVVIFHKKTPQLQPTVDVWVSMEKDPKTGATTKRAVRVVEMESSHIKRWIAYYRRKWRDNVPGAGDKTDAEIDGLIMGAIITAPAIYAEAKKRGVYYAYNAPKAIIAAKTPKSKEELLEAYKEAIKASGLTAEDVLKALGEDDPLANSPTLPHGGKRRIVIDE